LYYDSGQCIIVLKSVSSGIYTFDLLIYNVQKAPVKTGMELGDVHLQFSNSEAKPPAMPG